MGSKARIGIITALPEVELPAIQNAFGIEITSKPDVLHKGERYWTTRIQNFRGDDLEVIVTCIGLSGNTESQLPVERILDKFAPEFLILVGIACGITSMHYGDVVTSDCVWAYEYIKTQESGGNLDRSRAKITPSHIQNDLQFFSSSESWYSLLNQLQKILPEHQKPRVKVIRPELHRRIWIASGEKVMGDGEIDRLHSKHDYIRAGEMEGYGFATACVDRLPPVSWLIVRGISDHGNVEKDNKDANDPTKPLKDEYHLTAANSAASFVKIFLESSYVPTFWSENYKVFSSIQDPKFVEQLLDDIENCDDKIIISGLGLSLLKKNSNILKLIASQLNTNKRLKLDIFYCDPKNRGLKNRVQEEIKANRDKRKYRSDWPESYLESIKIKMANEFSKISLKRVSLNLLSVMPTFSLILINNKYYFAPYGTPDIIGPDSPLLMFHGDVDTNKKIVEFFEKCISSLYNNISKKLF